VTATKLQTTGNISTSTTAVNTGIQSTSLSVSTTNSTTGGSY
jgi:hypothetical protein